MNQIVTGALAMAFAIIGLFFLRFWRESRDQLFAFFALSFFAMAINRVLLGFAADNRHYLYWVRLIAFGLILLAVLGKNRSGKLPNA